MKTFYDSKKSTQLLVFRLLAILSLITFIIEVFLNYQGVTTNNLHYLIGLINGIILAIVTYTTYMILTSYFKKIKNFKEKVQEEKEQEKMLAEQRYVNIWSRWASAES